MSVDLTIGSPTGRFTQATGFPHFTMERAVVLRCHFCGCIFLPSDDGEVYYPNRFEFNDVYGAGCNEACECHEIPGEVS